jgi:superfamily II DNA or RNA helicase
MELRDYQERAVSSAMDSLRGGGSTLLVMATGLGKTVVFSEIIRRYMAQGTGRRALVLAHRAELIHQAAEKIRAIVGCDVEIEMADLRAHEDRFYRAPVVVSSVATQVAGSGDRKRMHKFNPEHFGIVVVDEAHHAVAGSYERTLAHYMQGNRCRLLGVTATPDRADEIALGKVFGSVCFEYGIRQGIEDGWLAPIMQRMVSVRSLDYSQCRTTAGDLNGADLDGVMQYEETLHGMVYPTIEIAGDRRGLIFAASVAHADRVAEIINRHRAGSAVSVNASTPADDRRNLFRGFSEGRYQWLVNVGVATEGWDDSALDRRGVQIIAMMRPTKSRALYSQMIGRGTRPLPGCVDGIEGSDARRQAIASSAKPHITVLDYCGNAGRHRLVHCADALAGKDRDVIADCAGAAMRRDAVDADVDVLALMTREEAELKREQEAERRRGLRVKAAYVSALIDPFALVDLAPDRQQAWEKGIPASEKQLSVLRRLKVGIPDRLTRKEASRLIDAAISTPTPKQSAVLLRAGLDPANYDRRSASAAIDQIMQGKEATR